MAERRAGLGRGLGELFQRTDLEAPAHPVDQHVIVDKLHGAKPGESPARSQASTARPTASRTTQAPAEATRTTDNSPVNAKRDGAPGAPQEAERSQGVRNVREAQAIVTDDAAAVEADAATTEGSNGGREGVVDPANGYYAEIPIERIHANLKQPRQVFDEDALQELVGSIREVGLLQPIVVREDGYGAYELVMGERRWRASALAGLETVPSIVRETADDDMLRDALLENIHRVQLNPLEEAAAYQQLMEDFGCTQQELGARIKRSRSQIANMIRLLNLPPSVQRQVAAGDISAGHARALLGLPDRWAQERLATRIVTEGLSVRKTEEIVAGGSDQGPQPGRRNGRDRDPRLQELSTQLGDYFDTRVEVTRGARKGKIVMEFVSEEDLQRIMDLLQPGSRRPARTA
ncbi:ParB/RepB/Spo0J family partition protein [Raineyella sp.]|uniref:Nucleoid occlusion protein n=1 Tax=bioreactor metagenome TaxID=1076179 RepID=A0A644XZW6_9ZZZZ